MMVQSRPHHLRHQWSQISTVVFILFLNHIHHHTYFNSSYVHIQVFPILHHHIMKLLLAFKSFLPRRLIVGIGSENWFAAGCPIRQRELVRHRLPVRQRELHRCWRHSFAAQHTTRQRISLRCRRFSCGSETEFRCATHKSAANINSLQEVQLRQRNKISLCNTQIGNEYQFAAAGSVAAAKQKHTNRQRISIRCRRFSCGSKTEFRCATHKSTANINSLQQVQLRQRKLCRYRFLYR